MRAWPALDVFGVEDTERLLADADEFEPSALEPRDDRQRLFFSTTAARRAAQSALSAHYQIQAVDVPDDDWARRSQDNLTPVIVGRVTIAPPWAANTTVGTALPSPASGRQAPAVTVVIQPSMGFGTGHHATTRLCVQALQRLNLGGCSVLDVGTGSGVLALVARSLGAASVLGIDNDADAVESARENLSLNPEVGGVRFVVSDAQVASLPTVDIVTANLTGAALTRMAARLLDAVRPGGALLVSGVMQEERDVVVQAFADARVEWEAEEDEWVGLVLRRAESA